MIGYILCSVTGAIIGGLLVSHIKSLVNLTTEEYAHCVQIVMNDYDKEKGDAQRLLLELQHYACDETVDITDLSADGIEIVCKVKVPKL